MPYRVPRADMTLAESEAARRQLRALKAADRTEARLFDRVLQVRAIEQEGRTTTSRMKAERSRQARRAVSAPRLHDDGTAAPPAPGVSSAHTLKLASVLSCARAAPRLLAGHGLGMKAL